MREDGTRDELEQVLNDPRSGTAAECELAARKMHKIAEDTLSIPFQDEAEQKQARKQMATFLDMSGEDAAADFAVYEKAHEAFAGRQGRKAGGGAELVEARLKARRR